MNVDEQFRFDSTCARLQKSINAYFCDFSLTWLIGCDELPQSLKLLEQNCTSGSVKQTQSDDFDSCKNFRVSNLSDNNVQTSTMKMNDDLCEKLQPDLIASFAIVKDGKAKLQKVNELMTSFIDDVLDAEVVQYLQNVVKVKHFDSGSHASQVEETEKLELGNELKISDIRSRNSKLISFDEPISGPSTTDVKEFRIAVEKFEKERVSSPNPYIFFCKVREYLNANREKDFELVTELESLLTNAARKSGILKD